MRNPQGYAIITDPDNPTQEWDTVTCAHCNNVLFIKPFQDPSECGGFCGMCAKHICGPCNALGVCVPFEKKLELLERSHRR